MKAHLGRKLSTESEALSPVAFEQGVMCIAPLDDSMHQNARRTPQCDCLGQRPHQMWPLQSEYISPQQGRHKSTPPCHRKWQPPHLVPGRKWLENQRQQEIPIVWHLLRNQLRRPRTRARQALQPSRLARLAAMRFSLSSLQCSLLRGSRNQIQGGWRIPI